MSTLPYTKKELVRAIESAQYNLEHSEDEWETMDIRYSDDRGVYFIETEHEDGGYTLESKVDIDFDPECLADVIIDREEEIKSL